MFHGMCPGLLGKDSQNRQLKQKNSHCKVSVMMWAQFDQILGCLESKEVWSSWRLVAPYLNEVPNSVVIYFNLTEAGNYVSKPTFTGWRFGTFLIFPYIGNNHPN